MAIHASGSVAQKGSRIEVSAHSTSGKLYARIVNSRRVKGCGRANSQTHKEAIISIERCEAVDQLSAMLATLRAHKDCLVWNPAAELSRKRQTTQT